MSHARLVINGRTELDENITPGQKQPPAILADMIKPGARKQPYLMAAAAALAEAVMKNQPINININTRPTGWTLDVNHTHALTPGST
jgi:hypothetical protein